jgi:hypothetical protein
MINESSVLCSCNFALVSDRHFDQYMCYITKLLIIHTFFIMHSNDTGIFARRRQLHSPIFL